MAGAALAGNPFFVATRVSAPLFIPLCWVEFKPEVIQFW